MLNALNPVFSLISYLSVPAPGNDVCVFPKVFCKSKPSGSQKPLLPAIKKSLNSLVLLRFDCNERHAGSRVAWNSIWFMLLFSSCYVELWYLLDME